MTPFGTSVARELRAAVIPLETTSIIDFIDLERTMRALLGNALFYVVPTPAIEAARDATLLNAKTLSNTIQEVGVRPQGISLDVDRARADAIVALQGLIDAVAQAEPTLTARCLGIA